MAAKPKMRLVSKFPEVKRASREITQLAITQATLAGQNKADDRIASNDMKTGYNLPIDTQKDVRPMQGRITYDHWWGRFFEYGTVYIPAVPFMRPANREMRKVFTTIMGKEFEGWVRRRAGVRR